MGRFKMTAAAFAAVAATGLWASAVPAAAEGALKAGGTGTGIGLLGRLGTAYQDVDPEFAITIAPSLGSGGGIRALKDGKIDFAVSAREPKPGEGDGLTSIPIAVTPLVFVTSRTPAQEEEFGTGPLAAALDGSMQRWPDGEPVRLVLRGPTETSVKLLRRSAPELDRGFEAAFGRANVMRAFSDQQALSLAEKTAGSLAFSSLAAVLSEERALAVLPFGRWTPAAPGGTENYPYLIRLYAILGPNPPPAADAFAKFILSERGRKEMGRFGAFPPETKLAQAP